jgi:hypothetical protein
MVKLEHTQYLLKLYKACNVDFFYERNVYIQLILYNKFYCEMQ